MNNAWQIARIRTLRRTSTAGALGGVTASVVMIYRFFSRPNEADIGTVDDMPDNAISQIIADRIHGQVRRRLGIEYPASDAPVAIIPYRLPHVEPTIRVHQLAGHEAGGIRG